MTDTMSTKRNAGEETEETLNQTRQYQLPTLQRTSKITSGLFEDSFRLSLMRAILTIFLIHRV